VFVAVASFAADKRLSDRQMDAVTAAGSGAITLGDSAAKITDNNSIIIDNTAGTNATALNFVVGTGSFVGTGTNLWYAGNNSASPEWVRQRNFISQNLGGGAYLVDYQPGLRVGLDDLLILVAGAEYSDTSSPFFSGPQFGLDGLLVGLAGLDVHYGGAVPFATAEFITTDDADLTYSSTNSTTIDRGAMTGLKALNVVSASNSLVGLGLNLAVTSQDMMTPKFINQANFINQRY
jgi:hypothetical protein